MMTNMAYSVASELINESKRVMKKMINIVIDNYQYTMTDQELLHAVDSAYTKAIKGSTFDSVEHMKYWYNKS
jgi:hypothetical protein